MKKAILILTMITLLTPGIPANAKSHRRTVAGTVKSAYTIRTKDGHVWKVSKKLKKGRKVKVKFDTRGTRRKEDDIILRVTYR